MRGEIVKEIFRREGLKQCDVAALLGETPQNLNAILTSKDIKSGTLERIARRCNKPITWFYETDEFEDLLPKSEEELDPEKTKIPIQLYAEQVRIVEHLKMRISLLETELSIYRPQKP